MLRDMSTWPNNLPPIDDLTEEDIRAQNLKRIFPQVAEVGPIVPESAVIGDVWFDTVNAVAWLFNGNEWLRISPA